MPFLSGYSYRKKITVQTAYLDAGLTDFPLYVPINADSVIGARCRSDGYDLRFTASDGTTLLSYERVSFAVAAGAATGIFWVKTDLATSPATDIYCYYGKADATDGQSVAATWTAYTRAWHLSEAYGTGAGNYKDSCGVGNLTLTDADGDSGQGDGIVGKCVDLNGDADYLTDADHADHDPGGAMTIEAWCYPHTMDLQFAPIHHDLSNYKYLLYVDGALGTTAKLNTYVRTASGVRQAIGTNILSATTWYYLAGTFDKTLASSRIINYFNGVPDGTNDSFNEDILAGDEGIRLGNWSLKYQDGLMHEVRYSKDAKSAAWIKFVYRNITEADNELTWTAEESFGSDIFFWGANF